ncbi:hypothetical protein LPC08_02265 [Roseomonas sp. OT10]|uniref:hypothetical protein n=1 Tax=Roseomonas cutis TaxID=2897332 RepID=UPI001E57E81F|nr:hypothetical protein [Roseomonas sp. OT10]UFN49491.1 hypothetical protein LPC08_02265 [Roseomonas sp. OT10]
MNSRDNLRMLHGKAVEARAQHVAAALDRPHYAPAGRQLPAAQKMVDGLRRELTPSLRDEADAPLRRED